MRAAPPPRDVQGCRLDQSYSPVTHCCLFYQSRSLDIKCNFRGATRFSPRRRHVPLPASAARPQESLTSWTQAKMPCRTQTSTQTLSRVNPPPGPRLQCDLPHIDFHPQCILCRQPFRHCHGKEISTKHHGKRTRTPINWVIRAGHEHLRI